MAVFSVAAEISLGHPRADRIGLAALVSNLGFLALLVLAASESRVVKPWPWVVGWAILGGLLVLHSRWPGRAWVQMAAGLGPALGIIISIENYGPSAIGLESWAWLGLIVFVAIVFQVLSILTRDEEQHAWAERTAAATAIALMVAASWVSSADRTASLSSIATVLILGILATVTVFDPSRIAGSVNPTMTSRLKASPHSAPSPRHLPTNNTANTKTASSQIIGSARW